MSTDTDKKSRYTKWGNIVFVCIIILVLVAGLIRTVFFPKDINYYENRYSNKMIAPSKDAILDSRFQNSMEDALSDQIPGAQRLKKVYNQAMSLFSNFLVTPILEDNSGTYVNYKNNLKIFNGYYVYGAYELQDVANDLKTKADNYNQIFKAYPEIEFYTYYIHKDTDINFETNKNIHADEYFFSLLELDRGQTGAFPLENFKDLSDYFYKTDHHWKHAGSYKAYRDIVDLLGCEGVPIEKGREVLIAEKYTGSKAATAGSDLITEPFYAYEFDFPAFKQITRGQENNYGLQEEMIASAPVSSISYGNFYGTDDGETIFDTGKTNLENILIIGDSFDNAILKLLATHFNKTYSVDLRNYEYATSHKFNFKQYVTENEIDKVLFIGGLDFYYSKTFELENP